MLESFAFCHVLSSMLEMDRDMDDLNDIWDHGLETKLMIDNDEISIVKKYVKDDLSS